MTRPGAVDNLKAKFGKGGNAEIVQHPTTVTPDKIAIPPVLAVQAESESKQQAEQDTVRKLAGVISSVNCAIDQYGGFVLQVKVGQRLEVLPLESAAGEDAIRAALKAVTGKMPPKSVLETTQAEIRIATRNADRRVKTYRRVGRDHGAYLIDLGDAKGRAVRVENGVWNVVDSGACAFIRARGYAVLPEPVRPVSVHDALTILLMFMMGSGDGQVARTDGYCDVGVLAATWCDVSGVAVLWTTR